MPPHYSRLMTSFHRFCYCLSALSVTAALSRVCRSTARSPVILRVGGAGGFKLPDKNATDPQSRANRAIVDAFEREHPGIQLQGAQGLQIGGPAAESSLLHGLCRRHRARCRLCQLPQLGQLHRQGFLMPLDGYLKHDPQIIARLKPEIRKVLLDAGHGHVYSLPYAQFVQALVLPQRSVPDGRPGPG